MTGVKNEKEIRADIDEIKGASKSTNDGMGTRASGESHVRFDPINNLLKSWIEKPVEPVSSWTPLMAMSLGPRPFSSTLTQSAAIIFREKY